MIILEKMGGRTVHLFIPFEHNKQRVESITLAPLRFGHVLGWGKGEWETSIDLLVDLAGVDKAVIMELRYPDADRVMECFMAILTPEIRNDISEGRTPLKPEIDLTMDMPHELAPTNGSGKQMEEVPPGMLGPGVPLPETGFDMSEEP